MEQELLINILGTLAATCLGSYLPTVSDRIKEKEKRKRIEIIKEEIPDCMWIKDDEAMFPDEIKPLPMTTRHMRSTFFSGEGMTIDEVYHELNDLKEKGLLKIKKDSKRRKTVVWMSISRDDVGKSVSIDKNGVTIHSLE